MQQFIYRLDVGWYCCGCVPFISSIYIINTTYIGKQRDLLFVSLPPTRLTSYSFFMWHLILCNESNKAFATSSSCLVWHKAFVKLVGLSSLAFLESISCATSVVAITPNYLTECTYFLLVFHSPLPPLSHCQIQKPIRFSNTLRLILHV